MRRSRFRKVQAFAATILAGGVAVGTAVILLLERFVAEVDDEERRAAEMPDLQSRGSKVDSPEDCR